jgi:hypothetical protein
MARQAIGEWRVLGGDKWRWRKRMLARLRMMARSK